ncbi:MAG: NUDIX hydrolase [Candidatus Pacearchaeota archaeon]
MKDKVNWQGKTYEMEWLDEFDDLFLDKLQQVYGFLFDDKGNICIVRPTEKRGWRLPGGGPEKQDKDWRETIIREAIEEADIEIEKDSLKIVGLIKNTPISKNCEREEGYALRVVGNISSINSQTEDIAEGLINERKFVKPEEFLDYCQWGKFGEFQIKKALGVYRK